MAHTPGAEFYEERLRRARALPPEQRGVAAAAWLARHDALEPALAALPELRGSAVLKEPAGGNERDACAPIRGTVDAHMAHSPARWQPDIRQAGMAVVREGGERVVAQPVPACDACGLPSAGLRSCPCRQVRRRLLGCWRSDSGGCFAPV